MDLSLVLLAGIVVGLTSFVLARNGTKTKSSVVIKSRGEDVYRAADTPERIITAPTGVTTIYESFERALKKSGNKKCIGTRQKTGKDSWGEFHWKTYKEINTKAINFGAGLISLGAKPGDRIGIFSKNREEWFVTQQACFGQSLVIVSFYETLGKDSIRYVADHSEIIIAICDGGSLTKLFDVIEGKKGYKGLKHLIVMDEPDDAEGPREHAKNLGVELHMFSDILEFGLRNPADLHPPKPSDLCTIMYTSGTTGTPKGVLLTHANLVAELAGIEGVYEVPNELIHFSYLPLAHIFERVIMLTAIHNGGQVGFFHGDILAVPDDLKALRPTIFIGVPRIFDKTKDGVLKKVKEAGFVAETVFNTAFALKKFSILHAPFLPTGFLDTLVFNKAKAGVGGKVVLMLSAGAPLSTQTELFLRVVFGVPVSQGYGLTETCGATTFKRANDPSVGHLGGPLPCNEYKLVDLPDMGYTIKDKPNARGELWIRGPNVTQGYYKDKEKTEESFKEGGWFLTGDIAEVDSSNGSLRIVDRKKNLLKLAQGEYVAVEQVEDKLTRACPDLEQICVHGDSDQSSIVAIVVPKSKGAKNDDKSARDAMLKKLTEAGKSEGLQGFEIPRSVWFAEEPFSQENDQMTPTMKLKRNAIKDKYKEAIAKMYQEAAKK